MTEPSDIDPPLDSGDRELAGRLAGERPVPGAHFRGLLGRRLVAADPGYPPRPPRLRATATAYLLVGGAVTTLGALPALGAL
ncbi:MAG: hypothetical protein M3076_05970 [Actinomycetota bacterium]|nr:hypothetical protein [Actinomycetota bacterium]